MKIAASHLLARYQEQMRVPRPVASLRAALLQEVERPRVSAQEQAFIEKLLDAAAGEELPAGVAELAKGQHVDFQA